MRRAVFSCLVFVFEKIPAPPLNPSVPPAPSFLSATAGTGGYADIIFGALLLQEFSSSGAPKYEASISDLGKLTLVERLLSKLEASLPNWRPKWRVPFLLFGRGPKGEAKVEHEAQRGKQCCTREPKEATRGQDVLSALSSSSRVSRVLSGLSSPQCAQCHFSVSSVSCFLRVHNASSMASFLLSVPNATPRSAPLSSVPSMFPMPLQ